MDDDPETPEVEAPTITVDAFTYDDAGRMTSRDVDDIATTLTWDVSSNLVATSGQGGDRVYLYDASGQRVAQLVVGDLEASVPVSATVYLGATEATDADAAGAGGLSATRYYAGGGATVATATAAGGPMVWSLLLGDIQGSATVSMELMPDTGAASGFQDASTAHEIVRDMHLPYGAQRGSVDLEIDRGWLGQYEDTATGLTYLNARYYDPVLGRFLSPDPLMNPGDPRTLDPYRYADNNPISHTDATGLCSALVGVSLDAIMQCGIAAKYADNRMAEVRNTTREAASCSASNGGGGPLSHACEEALKAHEAVKGPTSAKGAGGTTRKLAPPKNYDPYQRNGGSSGGDRARAIDHALENGLVNPGADATGDANFWRGLRALLGTQGLIFGVSGFARLAAELGGANCAWSRQEMITVCGDAPSWLYQGGGTMLGTVYVDGDPLEQVLEDERLLAHEAKHLDQAVLLGMPLFALGYAIDFATAPRHWVNDEKGGQREVRCTFFEAAAGYADGGYSTCT